MEAYTIDADADTEETIQADAVRLNKLDNGVVLYEFIAYGGGSAVKHEEVVAQYPIDKVLGWRKGE